MLKSELAERVARRAGSIPQKHIDLIMNTILGEIADALKRGDRVELRGFGVFSGKPREPRLARNPKSGESIPINGKRAPRFKSSKEMFARLNDGYRPASDPEKSG